MLSRSPGLLAKTKIPNKKACDAGSIVVQGSSVPVTKATSGVKRTVRAPVLAPVSSFKGFAKKRKLSTPAVVATVEDL